MTQTKNNPAAQQGWVQSTDPRTGRVFYANHITRKTQWEPPEGWIDESAASFEPDDDEPLPSNWQVLHDPTTGKPFYVDHVRKITTWTRPRPEQQTQVNPAPLKPAVPTPPSSGNRAWNSATYSTNSNTTPRSYQQEAMFYSPPAPTDVDLSDTLPLLDFRVETVPDALRLNCANCQAMFTVSKRRHHCRLCGDVFCDACSSHRVTLPLEGTEFEKPVRVCDYCHQDVQRGNFFSWRRYLTPLHLYEDTSQEDRAKHVNEALSALTNDVDQMLQTGEMANLNTIPPQVLMPEIVKHLGHTSTADRAVRAVASLLALDAMNGQADYAVAVYASTQCVEKILEILERSGSDRKTLYVQEQAARIIFYLSEHKTVSLAMQNQLELEALDVARALRNLLDHASNTKNPNLARWSAASLRHLIREDERRSTMAINDLAAMVASGQEPKPLEYSSTLEELVSTGGILILCSLIGGSDPDTRAHAVSSLSAILASTRSIDESMATLFDMTGGMVGRNAAQDGGIVRAIVAGGGCGAPVAQLLLSADNNVAGMGCQFLSSLVMPLLEQAVGSLSTQYDVSRDESGLGACREAAVEICKGSCLPALLSIVRENTRRSTDLRKLGMETLASVVSTVGEMGKSWAHGQYEEGLERAGAPSQLKEAILALNEQGVLDVILEVLQSSGGQSLGSSQETAWSRIRESAGIILGSLTYSSAETIMEIQNRKVVSGLLLASNDPSMTMPSTLRGDRAPRCLGIIESVASILMFEWQHPSGASSQLLDRLIEVIDAGIIPFLSRVINMKMDWDSKVTAIGGMKGRTAACRFLCCLFGIALTDETPIGLRRLWESVDSDARSYRGGDKAPSNIVESVLGVLQTSSQYARKVVMGSDSYSSYYHEALMELVEASLLAAGSMCGSSIAPGGSEGTMITGETFLVERRDIYAARRKDICNIVCDIIVRKGRSGPALLPTMLVGGFGEGTVLASLRTVLAIAQNGTNDQHAKLALSGILVPVSDSLRTALSKGDLYKFSAALALVRFCGPHVAAGQSGGVESVRDAIRVATNVLTLPVNPNATIEQIETQDALKSECISAIESLSKNASLWSSISSDALPAVVQYLESISSLGEGESRRQQTKRAALKTVLQIVQVPSHATAAVGAGLVGALGKLLEYADDGSQQDETPMLVLEIMHAIASNSAARKNAKILESGFVGSICAALALAATDHAEKSTDSRADITFLGLEILHSTLSDIQDGLSIQQVLQSPLAQGFIDSVAAEPAFVRAMCSTLLVRTGMKLSVGGQRDGDEKQYDIPKVYGPPLILVQDTCAGYGGTHDASAALFFTVSVYASAIESKRSEKFWETVFLQDKNENASREDIHRACASFCAYVLSLLADDYPPFQPIDNRKKSEQNQLLKPLVRYRLLEALKDSFQLSSTETKYARNGDPYMVSVMTTFNVPRVCIDLWSDSALLDLAFELIKHIVEQEPDAILPMFVEGKSAIMSLFNLLRIDLTAETSTSTTDIRRFLATILTKLADGGVLTDAVNRFDARSSAITALASACLAEEERPPDEDEDVTANKLSSVLMKCLVDLCSTPDSLEPEKQIIVLSSSEASDLANSIGKKICHMVISRFIERAKLKHYEMDDDDEIVSAPDVAMLCAIAQHDDALQTLRSIGGLHALSLVAGEREPRAIAALKNISSGNPGLLLEGDTYLSLMHLLASDHEDRISTSLRRETECAAFELLAMLANKSNHGRNAIASADDCEVCIARALELISHVVDENITLREESGNGKPPDLDTPDDGTTLVEKSTRLSMTDDDYPKVAGAACLFLSSLAPTDIGRKALVENNNSLRILSTLIHDRSPMELRYAALKVVTSLASYATNNENTSTDKMADVFLAILKSTENGKSSVSFRLIMLYSVAVNGINIIFDKLSPGKRSEAISAISDHFKKSVKSCTVAKTSIQDDESIRSAEFTYDLTLALLLSRGKDLDEVVFTQDLLTSMIHLLQWRHDPKNSIETTCSRYWDGAIGNCLILLSTILSKPEEDLVKLHLTAEDLGKTSLMLARAGKAPRKAIDPEAALDRIIDGQDSASVAAQRVKNLLFF